MRVRKANKYQYEQFRLWKYPNFSSNGSISGMKNLYYGKDALLVRCGSYIYNVPSNIYYSCT